MTEDWDAPEAETLFDLMRAIEDTLTAGYLVEVKVRQRGKSPFLIIDVETNAPLMKDYASVRGQWWFWDDGKVMQVL